MKKSIKRLTALIFAAALIISACPMALAESVVKVNGITYVIDGKSAEVYKYDGGGGNVVIPSKVNGATVTSVGNYAFAEEYGKTEASKRITGVSLPETVRSVGKGAFMECSSLKYIDLPMSVTTLGDAVFWYCENLEKLSAFSELKSIGTNVFGRCSKLTVYCESGSAVEAYAKSNGVRVKALYPSSVSIKNKNISLIKGASLKLSAVFSPADCYYKDLVWSSDNRSIVSVDQSGKITAKAYGKTTVRCYGILGDAETSCTIRVEVPQVTGLSCTDRTLNGYTVKWKKAAGATGYKLQKYEHDKWQTVKTTGKTKYTFKNLKEGSSCKYRVRAYTETGSGKVWGKWSDILTASTKSVAKVKGLTMSANTSKSVTLKWNKAADADGYTVYCYNAKTKKYEKLKTTTRTSFTHENLSAGQENTYKVRGYMKVGDKKVYGKYSSELKACAAPAKVKNVKASEATKTTLTVGWSKVKNADGYTVNITGTNFSKTVNTSKNSYKFTGLSKNTRYTVKVRAFINCCGKSRPGSYSEKMTASTNYIPTSVADITAEFNEALLKTASSRKFYASKTADTSAQVTHYHVYDRYALNTVKALVNDYCGSSVVTADFENGADKSSGMKTVPFFFSSGSVQAMPASAVKSASFKKDGSGFIVSLGLKAETAKNNTLPANNSRLAPVINWKSIAADIASDASITSTSTSYTGTSVKGKINKFGKFDTLTVSMPFTSDISGKINGKNCDITVQGRKTLDFVITWW
ncbi:MAG: fibronectin type III domain-containing protein [Oscillospiraceae bacterium]|nr:fibronectin type III domain-containing protein [Oscillospiraceae bacterium]